jgi:hypothetical protein
MKKLLPPLIISFALVSCGTSEVMRNADNQTFSVSSSQGLPTGGWNAASSQASSKAVDYCQSTGKKYIFNNEQRTGTPGFTLLTSTVNFSCVADNSALFKEARDDCNTQLQTKELDPIRDKVELSRASSGSPPPFDVAANKAFPTANERIAIAKWAKIREGCVSRSDEIFKVNNQHSTPMSSVYLEKQLEFSRQISGQVGALIVALYQMKLSYGEFATKRYEMTTSIASAERDFRAAAIMQDRQMSQQDRDMQLKSQQVVLQQQQNNINAWNVYMQSVNARKPQTIRLQTDCKTTRIGDMSSTECR